MQTRIDYIIRSLDANGRVKVADLSRELGCSEVTIRSDIQRMEQQGLLKRIHGGAVKVETQLTIPFASGNILKHVEKKKRIAERASGYIQDGDTIILDDSSVSYYLAKIIESDTSKNLVVITNSLVVGSVLALKSHVSLIMTGGQVAGKQACTMGELTTGTLAGLRADKAFISAHGLNFDVGITSIGSAQMHVKKAIVEAAEEIYLMMDSSKFDGGYVLVVCPLDRISAIVTDNEVQAKYIEQAKERKVKMDVV